MDVKDYYQALGVPRTATQAEIKKAFRKLAREYHPDKRPGDTVAERRFKELNEANEVLSDPAKREKYDRFGKDWEAYERAGAAAGGAGAGGAFSGNPFGPGGPFAQYASGGAGPGGVRYEFHTTGGGGDFSDFFNMLFGAGAGAPGAAGRGGGRGTGGFGDLFGSGARAAQRELAPVEAEAEVTLEEAFHGTTRIVEVGGRRLEVTIPKGVDSGSRVRLTGKGPDGRDLVVVVRLAPHRAFVRRGADLEREVAVSLREALLGGEVRIPTLKGRIALTIPAGTQNGRTFRLTGQGMPRLKGGDTGDLYVRVRVVLPTNLSPEASEAATRFLDLADQPDPRA